MKPKIGLISLLILLFSIVFWASAFVAIRDSLVSYSPGSLALLRFLTASAILIVYAVFKKIKPPRIKDIPLFLLAGLLGISMYHYFLNAGEQKVHAGTASFLVSTVPLITALLSWLIFGEKLRFGRFIGLIIGLLGIAIISFTEGKPGELNIHTVFVLIAALGGSSYVLFQHKLQQKYTPLEFTIYTLWSGTIFLLIFIPELITEWPQSTLRSTLEVLYLGIFPAALAYLLWAHAYAKIKSPSAITSFLYLSPVVTLIIGIIWIGEYPGLLPLAGGFISLSGVVLANTLSK